MLIERFFTPELAQVAYAVGDRDRGEVVIIDPRRDVDEYVQWARENDLRIVGILETHVHADFVSGAPILAVETGAPIYASRLGNQDFEHTPVDGGFVLEIGQAKITAVHTPGHTPEHISWKAEDTRDPDAAAVVFSGDTLFVGDVGRPDLLGTEQTDSLVEQLYQTVTNVFQKLPEGTIVYPGHTAGSSCGKMIGDDPNTTIGREQRENYAFQPESATKFKEAVMGGMPSAPTYYPELKKVNKVGAEAIATLPEGTELSTEAVAEKLANGAMVVDTRSKRTVAQGYIPGTVFVGAGNDLSSWMGWFAPYDRDIVLFVESEKDYEQSRLMLHRIGLDRVVGYMNGIDGWKASGRELATIGEVTVESVKDRLGQPGAPIVLDVRSKSEFDDGHIPGAVHHFLGEMTQGDMPDLPKDSEIQVICGSGYRSMIASTLMSNAGFTDVNSVLGGMDAWNEKQNRIAA